MIVISWTCTRGSIEECIGAAVPTGLHTQARRSTAAARGVAALEDKIVQRATIAVLNAIYEEDFLGFSYGFLIHPHSSAPT